MSSSSRSFRVSYQGERGAHSEAAIRLLFKNTPYTPIPHPNNNFANTFQALENGSVDFAMVPIENNLGGSIYDNYDLLVRHDTVITAELQYRVHHCLMCLPGQSIENITTVISHPQALAQSDVFLKSLGPHVKAERHYDTAGAAKSISENRIVGTAAIASRLSAEIYGLSVLAHDIEDERDNVTRFLLLSRPMSPPPPLPLSLSPSPLHYRTSLVFSLSSRPGMLFKALSVFALRDIQLSKIESRPAKQSQLTLLDKHSRGIGQELVHEKEAEQSFKYLFFADVEGRASDSDVARAIEHLSELAIHLRVLGEFIVFKHDTLDITPTTSPTAAITTTASTSTQTETNAVSFVATSTPAISAAVPSLKPLSVSSSLSSSSSSSPSSSSLSCSSPLLRIGIVGLGTFGQFLCKCFTGQGHTVSAVWSRSDYSEWCKQTPGVQMFTTNVEEFASKCNREAVDVIIFAVSILSFESTLANFPFKLLGDSSPLIVDVLSVKSHAKQVLLRYCPSHLEILCTHPMFGPESARHSWMGLAFVYDFVRSKSIKQQLSSSPSLSLSSSSSSSSVAPSVARRFLHIFQRQGCRMVPLSCEKHDEAAAGSQFITHTIGRMLSHVGVKPTDINTKGFSTLLEVMDCTVKDSFDLYRGLYVFNPYSAQQLDALERALSHIRSQLSNKASSIISRRVLSMNESKTASVDAVVKRLQSSGARIISLNVGEPRQQPPAVVVESIINAVRNGDTKYTMVQGTIALRTRIAVKLKRENGLDYTPDQIVVSNGGKQCIAQAVLALCDQGDEVIIPAPYWVSYPDMVTLASGKPVIVQTHEADGYQLPVHEIEKSITERTKLIIVCSPNNPTGGTYSLQVLTDFCLMLQRHPRIIVLSDEIYEHLVYDGHVHTSLASLPGMYNRTLTVNGFSKGYAMTGLRLGYVAGPSSIISAIVKVQSQLTSGASSLSQAAGCAALDIENRNDEPNIIDMMTTLNETRKIVIDKIQNGTLPNVTFVKPSGAFYALLNIKHYINGKYSKPKTSTTTATTTSSSSSSLSSTNDSNEAIDVIEDTTSFCVYLLDQFKVALVPGDAFGAPGYLRLSFAGTPAEVHGALDGLGACLKSLTQH